MEGRPSLQYSWLSLDVGAISRASASGIPIKPLEPALAFLNQQPPNDPEPFRVIGAGAAGVEVVLALRRRWPQRPLQLQVRPGQLSDALQRVLQEARVTLIQNQAPWMGPSLLCTGSHGPAWLANSGLPVNEQGRVQTGQLSTGQRKFKHLRQRRLRRNQRYATGGIGSVGSTCSNTTGPPIWNRPAKASPWSPGDLNGEHYN